MSYKQLKINNDITIFSGHDIQVRCNHCDGNCIIITNITNDHDYDVTCTKCLNMSKMSFHDLINAKINEIKEREEIDMNTKEYMFRGNKVIVHTKQIENIESDIDILHNRYEPSILDKIFSKYFNIGLCDGNIKIKYINYWNENTRTFELCVEIVDLIDKNKILNSGIFLNILVDRDEKLIIVTSMY